GYHDGHDSAPRLVWADARPTPAVGRALAAALAVAAREGWGAPGP
ncbi:MAG: hypothetical protein JHC74_15805, partial [Thermoleophilia bacterium]|nr:hypothetical protein [Thermoleophilia bacterium]